MRQERYIHALCVCVYKYILILDICECMYIQLARKNQRSC